MTTLRCDRRPTDHRIMMPAIRVESPGRFNESTSYINVINIHHCAGRTPFERSRLNSSL
jgi:hypothetical protein